MSNTWSYDLLAEPSSLTGESVRSAFRVLAIHGFNLFTSGREISGTAVDGLHDLTFDDMDRAVDWLAEEGGILPIWHPADPEIVGTISYADVREAMGRPAGESPLRHLGLGLTAGYFRPPSPREQIANIMRRAFMDLISAESPPPFAFVYDEESLEALPDVLGVVEQHYAAVAGRRPSPIVFWLNYFSPSYAAALGIERLRQLDGLAEEAGGYIWQLTEYPWELTSSELDTSRRLWASLFNV